MFLFGRFIEPFSRSTVMRCVHQSQWWWCLPLTVVFLLRNMLKNKIQNKESNKKHANTHTQEIRTSTISYTMGYSDTIDTHSMRLRDNNIRKKLLRERKNEEHNNKSRKRNEAPNNDRNWGKASKLYSDKHTICEMARCVPPCKL